ncbi:MAG: cytochrome C oxidase subunit IV family protein [Bryobacteraceae bacterium]
MADHSDNHQHHVPAVSAHWRLPCAHVVLTGIVAVAMLDLGKLQHTVVALAVAGTKAALVMWIFMELRHAPPLTRLAAITGVAFLAILLILVLTDYSIGRVWMPDPPTWLEKK